MTQASLLESGLVFQVSELLEELRGALEEGFGEVRVEGEVGSVFHSGAGHVYFDLKDDEGLLRCVMFRSRAARLPFELEDGAQVRALGGVDVYAPRGSLQLVVESLEPAGIGALRLAFERLRARLEAEGLFEPEHKQPLPHLPQRIGLVTSRSGAALHDFLRGLRRRGSGAEVVLCHSQVQGDGAWREVVRALHLLDADPSIDVIVLTRGGGSLEDLWTFNREEVARAVFELTTPIVSAIGHEVDVVLTDLVADRRAATPTAAAEIVVPDVAALRLRLSELERRLTRSQRQRLTELRHRLTGLERGLVHPAERLAGLARRLRDAESRAWQAVRATVNARRQRLDPLGARLKRASAGSQGRRSDRLSALGGRLQALSPLAVLGRGYALVRAASDGSVVTRSDQVSVGDEVDVRLAEGGLRAAVRETVPDP